MQATPGMETVPPKLVIAVAVILVALALFGAYQGFERSIIDTDTAVAAGLSPAGTPLPGAKTASALTEPTGATLTEAQIRDIARQEARGVLNRPEPSSAAASEGAASESAPKSGAAAGTTAAAVRAATPPPVLAPPAPPLQTPVPPETSNAPLF